MKKERRRGSAGPAGLARQAPGVVGGWGGGAKQTGWATASPLPRVHPCSHGCTRTASGCWGPQPLTVPLKQNCGAGPPHTIPVPPQLSGHRMRGWEMLLAGLGCPEPAPNHGVHPWGGCCPRLLAWGGGELPSLAPIKSPWYLYPVPLLLLAPAGTPNPATELSLGWGLRGERPPRMARAVPEVFGPPTMSGVWGLRCGQPGPLQSDPEGAELSRGRGAFGELALDFDSSRLRFFSRGLT